MSIFFDAKGFCLWGGLSLPTGEQWEKAARGTNGRVWPWGDEEPTAEHCNFDKHVGGPTPVGHYSPKGDSPFGCVDMVGNVWEWIKIGVRGGAWGIKDISVMRPPAIFNSDPSLRVNAIGFRVVELLSDPES